MTQNFEDAEKVADQRYIDLDRIEFQLTNRYVSGSPLTKLDVFRWLEAFLEYRVAIGLLNGGSGKHWDDRLKLAQACDMNPDLWIFFTTFAIEIVSERAEGGRPERALQRGLTSQMIKGNWLSKLKEALDASRSLFA